MADNMAPASLTIKNVQISMVCPDGTKFYIGYPNYQSDNFFVAYTRGLFERVRFQINRYRFHKLQSRYVRLGDNPNG